MFFPIGDDNVKGGYKPIFTYLLLLINIAMFFYELSLQENLNPFLEKYAFSPTEIMLLEDLQALFTSMFLHGGWMHLIGNMMFLWVFADNIEAVLGNTRFLIFYLLGGIIASLVQTFIFMDSSILTLGASGAIAAVLGAYLVMFPVSRIRVLFIIFTFHVPALIFLVIWIVQQFMNGYGALSDMSAGEGVAWWAHIGGFVYGFVAGIYYRTTLNTAKEHYV